MLGLIYAQTVVVNHRTSAQLPVNRIRPAYDQVAEQLRELIVQGALAPGDRLPVEAEMAAAFGVSRSTMREALRSLAASNLVYSVRGAAGGTFVAQSDPAAISEYLETGIGLLSCTAVVPLDALLEARELLEVPAARLAAQRRTGEHLADLRVALNEEASATESVRYRHHRRFHEAVLAAAGNGLLRVMTQPVFGVISSRFVLAPDQRDMWRAIDGDHAAILAHIESGDDDAAAATMHDHIVRLNAAYRALEVEPVTTPSFDG